MRVVGFLREDEPEIFEVEPVVVEEQEAQLAEVAEARHRGEVVIGNIQFDEIVAGLQRRQRKREGGMQDQQPQGLRIRDELLQRYVLIHSPNDLLYEVCSILTGVDCLSCFKDFIMG